MPRWIWASLLLLLERDGGLLEESRQIALHGRSKFFAAWVCGAAPPTPGECCCEPATVDLLPLAKFCRDTPHRAAAVGAKPSSLVPPAPL